MHVIKKKSVVPDEKKRVIKIIKNCKFCATDHPFRKCPAYGKKCENCSRMNHSAKACFSSKSKVDYIEADESTDDDSAFFVGSIEEGQVDAINWIMPLKVNGESIEFKIDTGSHVNLMTNKQFHLLPNKPTLNEEEVSLRAYNNTKIINHGTFTAMITCTSNGKMAKAQFVVVSNGHRALIGLDTAEQLGLVKTTIDEVRSELTGFGEDISAEVNSTYPELFTGIGCLPVVHKIKLIENAVPSIDYPRRIAVAIKDKLKKTLQTMVKDKIIRKIDEPTEWVSSVVVV